MAFFIFIAVMLLVYIRPLGTPIWLSACVGALLAFALGVVGYGDIIRVASMVWDSTLVLVGLIILAMSLEKVGFFHSLAKKIIKFSGAKEHCVGRDKFFIFMMIFGSFVAIFLANDGAILVLTPLIFAIFGSHPKKADLVTPVVAFSLFFGFLSDFASNLLTLSNLTNIITEKLFNISPVSYFFSMLLAEVFAVVAAMAVFWLVLGRRLPRIIKFKRADIEYLSKKEFIFSLFLLGSLPFGSVICSFYEVPLSIFVSLIALLGFSMAFKRARSVEILKKAPFGVVLFSLGLFVVVFGVANAGVLELLKGAARSLESLHEFISLLLVGFGSALGSALINNLPMVMLGDLALSDLAHSLVLAHLLGCNIGSKLTPIGSLGTLLWLFSLRRYGLKIALLDYFKIAFIWSSATLFAAICGLYLTYKFFDF